MGKYLMLWEVDQARVPISPQERGSGWGALIDMVKEDLKKGTLKDWGTFVGEISGYSVAEGTEVEIGNMIQQYVPWIIFKTHAIASVNQVDEIIKTLTR
jgi:hypothetical protein